MLKADLHTHSNFSHDGHSSISEMCEAAIAAGLQHLCLTDHYDFVTDPQNHYYTDYDDCLAHAAVAKKKFAGRINLLCGLEAGSMHRNADGAAKLHGFAVDMIIGSVHDFGPIFLGDPLLPEKFAPHEIFSAYFDEILAMVRFGGFDTIGHIDFPARYTKTPTLILPVIETIFREALAKNIIIEINTSPLRKGMDFTLPCEEILRIYRDCGGRFITTGSDAHRASDVAANFDRAEELLKRFALTPVIFVNRTMQER